MSSLAGSGIDGLKINSEAFSDALTVASGGITGGISSTIAGGYFWRGMRHGLITTGLNHIQHKFVNSFNKAEDSEVVNTESKDYNLNEESNPGPRMRALMARLRAAMKRKAYDKAKSKSTINKSNKIGGDYEEYLVNKLGGKGSFKYGGVEFDGAYKNVWYEAKAGNFWENVALKDVNKWKSKFGNYKSVANSENKQFHIYSQGSIPKEFKDFFNKKGITYFENYKK